MSGKRSRTKGARGELECFKVLGDELGQSLKRNLVQSREGGGDCLEVLGFCIEVKRVERLAIPAWWRQACAQAEDLRVEPILAFRQNYKPWRFLLKTVDGHREVSLIGAAEHIREKWARLYASYPETLNGLTYGYG
jgi:hypothetical protein